MKEHQFYMVREDVLSESMQKALEAKSLIERGKVKTVAEAAAQVGLSRSAFYKYRDGIFPFHTMVREKIITLFINLEDRSGALSSLLTVVASMGCNVLTINQTIPLQGRANVTLTIETNALKGEINDLLTTLKKMEAVERVEVIGSGA
ncbi:ACT domain-containing protein [Fictibacillus sp. Mic-4]|uniref:ACT domain-containing protein n=1 Tax=Fictibacillus TaxID=1329200 RepID=UPI00047B6358|nr:ACT domain-containing protein [Fictibacillus gelatini]